MSRIKVIRCDLCHKEFRETATTWYRGLYKYEAGSIWAGDLDFCSKCYGKMYRAEEPIIIHEDGKSTKKKEGEE